VLTAQHAMSVTPAADERGGQGQSSALLLSVRSVAFGQYRVPEQRIVSMTCGRVIELVAGWSAVAREARPDAAASGLQNARLMPPQLELQLDPALSQLNCGDWLRAELKALHQHRMAELIVKC
jgi:hypothetical protein